MRRAQTIPEFPYRMTAEKLRVCDVQPRGGKSRWLPTAENFFSTFISLQRPQLTSVRHEQAVNHGVD